MRGSSVGRRPPGVSSRPHTGPPTDRPPPSTLLCASHNPPDPAGADRGKGRPQADPEGTRSALPATEAAGTLIGWEARRRHRERADVRADSVPQPRVKTADRAPRRHRRALPPVPIQSPRGSTRPIRLRTSPTMKVQARRRISEELQVLNHAGGVRDVLACADQRVNRRHRRARAGPASRQLLAHEAMPRACPGSGLSPVVQNAARAAAEGADPAWSLASRR
jgi:hypothetical protein